MSLTSINFTRYLGLFFDDAGALETIRIQQDTRIMDGATVMMIKTGEQQALNPSETKIADLLGPALTSALGTVKTLQDQNSELAAQNAQLAEQVARLSDPNT